MWDYMSILMSSLMLYRKGETNMKNINKYCPFVNGDCKDNCVFKTFNTVISHSETKSCLIAIKLDDINGYQQDQLTEIEHDLSKKR